MALLRSGWSADRLLATARRPERAEELAGRYGIRVVDNADYRQSGEKGAITPELRKELQELDLREAAIVVVGIVHHPLARSI